MPLVLITGLNGFLGVHIALAFLTKGWSVRGTVRSAAKRSDVLALSSLKLYGEAGKLDVRVVPDMVDCTWEEELRAVTAVCHSASPFSFTAPNYDFFRRPNVEGVTKLLEAAARVSSIKSVGVVSSSSCVYNILQPISAHDGKVYTDKDFITWTEQDAVDPANGFHGGHWYCISKKYGELAAREVKQRTNATWSLATFPAERIIGPTEHIASLAELKASTDPSTEMMVQALCGGEDAPAPPDYNSFFVDVRDVAQAVYLALSTSASGRYLLASGPFGIQRLLDAARAARPDLAKWIPKGEPGRLGAESQKGYGYDTGKSVQELGVQYHTLQETAEATVKKLEELGAYQ
ncbi:hypothetical protein IAT38_000889 [Cryptococcus sp. DSM 104549]